MTVMDIILYYVGTLFLPLYLMTETSRHCISEKPRPWIMSIIIVMFIVKGHCQKRVDLMFRIVFWDVLLCKMVVDHHFTRQYIPEDNSEHHTLRRENLKSHVLI
jgi:hypothetical protein